MAGFVRSGRVADVVLMVILLEFFVLTVRRSRVRSGALRAPGSLDRALALAPGACLLLALRAALTQAGWVWIVVFITASFPFHLADLVRRRL